MVNGMDAQANRRRALKLTNIQLGRGIKGTGRETQEGIRYREDIQRVR